MELIEVVKGGVTKFIPPKRLQELKDKGYKVVEKKTKGGTK